MEKKIAAPGVKGLKMLENGLEEARQLVREAGALDDHPRLGGVEGVGELGQVGGVHVLHHGLQQAHHHQVQQHAPLQTVGTGGRRIIIFKFNLSFLRMTMQTL
jgi:hypothetical protein